MHLNLNNQLTDLRPDLRIAVVVPAHQAEDTLFACMKALICAGARATQIIVVDDGSQDSTGQIARSFGAAVLRNELSERPARARNFGAKQTDADIIIFVDADVVVAPTALIRLLSHFDDPGVTAVIGSYDAYPHNTAVVSQYRNLLHHFTHHLADAEVETFWTGLGAVRRAAFEKVGGFERAWENIEDVELGLRLRAAGGRIVLDASAQGTHLKMWTLGSMMRTDTFGRAIPWTRLLLQGRMPDGVMNTSQRHKRSAMLVAVFGSAVLAAPFWPQALWLAATCSALFVAQNADFFALLRRRGGMRLALGGIPCHALHYCAAMAGYLYARIHPGTP